MEKHTESQAAALRRLVDDLLEISQDGRTLAYDLGRTITELVTLQCDAIDSRARAILEDAEALERRS